MHRTCARRAADRRVPVVEQLVVRDLVLADVVPHLVELPVSHRVELHDAAVIAVDLDLRDVLPRLPLFATQARDPRVERGQLALQRLDLADLAAGDPQVDAAVHQVRALGRDELRNRIAIGVLELHGDAVPLADLLEQRVRLGRQAPGVQREHADLGVDAPRHVDQRHAVDATGGADRHPRVEAVERPLQQLFGRGVLEPVGGGVDRLDLFSRCTEARVRGSVLVRSCRFSHSGHGQLESPFADQTSPPARVVGTQILLAAERAVERDRSGRAHREPPTGAANRASCSSSSAFTNAPNDACVPRCCW